VQNFTKIIPLVLLGILHFGNAGAAIGLLPLTFVGSWLGRKFYNNASEKPLLHLLQRFASARFRGQCCLDGRS
jgi:hypothetical protein